MCPEFNLNPILYFLLHSSPSLFSASLHPCYLVSPCQLKLSTSVISFLQKSQLIKLMFSQCLIFKRHFDDTVSTKVVFHRNEYWNISRWLYLLRINYQRIRKYCIWKSLAFRPLSPSFSLTWKEHRKPVGKFSFYLSLCQYDVTLGNTFSKHAALQHRCHESLIKHA